MSPPGGGPAAGAPVLPAGPPSPPLADLIAAGGIEGQLIAAVRGNVETTLRAAHDAGESAAQALHDAVSTALKGAQDSWVNWHSNLEAWVLSAIGSAYEQLALMGYDPPTDDEIQALVPELAPAYPQLPPLPTGPPAAPVPAGPTTPVSTTPAGTGPVSDTPAGLAGGCPTTAPSGPLEWVTPALWSLYNSPGICNTANAGYVWGGKCSPAGRPGILDWGPVSPPQMWTSPVDGRQYPAHADPVSAGMPSYWLPYLPPLPAGWAIAVEPVATGGQYDINADNQVNGWGLWADGARPALDFARCGQDGNVTDTVPTPVPTPTPPPPGPGGVTCPPPVVNVTCPPPTINVYCGQQGNATGNGTPGPPPGPGGTSVLCPDGTEAATLGDCPDLPEAGNGTGAGGGQGGGAGGGKAVGPAWGRLDVCDTIDAVAANAQGLAASNVVNAVGADLLDPKVSPADYAARQTAGLPAWLRPVAEPALQGLTVLVRAVVGDETSRADCNALQSAIPVLARAAVAFVERWLDLGLADTRQNLTYWANYLCPTTIPSQGEAHRCFLADTIDQGLWKCWVRANNAWDVPAERVRQAMRARPSAGQLNALYRRGKISIVEWEKAVRGEGVLSDNERQRLADADNVWPSAPAVYAASARGLFGPGALARYGYGEGQDRALGDQGSKLLRGADLDDEWGPTAWAAHWALPTVGEGLEMWRRLGEAEVGEGLQTSEADFDHLLQAHGYPPFWARRLKAIAQPAPTRAELKSWFMLGLIDHGRAATQLVRNGQTVVQANNTVGVWQAQRRNRFSSDRVGRLYLAGAVNAAELGSYLSQQGMDQESQADLLAFLRRLRLAQVREACVEALHHRYLHGDGNAQQTVPALAALGLELDQAIALQQEWACQVASRAKSVPAAQLCAWAAQGIVTQAELLTRLQQLGYPLRDAQRIAQACNLKAQAAQAKAAQRTQAAKDRAAKAVATAKAKTAQALGKATSAAQRAAAQTAKRAGGRVRRAQRIIDRAVQAMGLAGPDAAQLVRDELDQLEREGGLGPDAALDLLQQVISDAKANKVSDWRPLLKGALADLKSLQGPPVQPAAPG